MKVRHAAMMAGLVFGLMAGAAHASIVTYDVSGTFADASILSGSFTVDNSKDGSDQFSDINVSVTGFSEFNKLYSVGYAGTNSGFGEYFIDFGNSGNDNLQLDFNANHNFFQLISVPSENLNTIADDTVTFTYVNSTPLVSGTISPALSAVPLPSSAPLFGAGLIALGAAGYAAKRKKATATS